MLSLMLFSQPFSLEISAVILPIMLMLMPMLTLMFLVKSRPNLRFLTQAVSCHVRYDSRAMCCVRYGTHVIEQFSTECRKTKTKVIALTNNKRCRQSNEPIRTRSKYM